MLCGWLLRLWESISAICTFTIRPAHHVVLSLSQRLRNSLVVIESRFVVSAKTRGDCEIAAITNTVAMADLVLFGLIIVAFSYSTIRVAGRPLSAKCQHQGVKQRRRRAAAWREAGFEWLQGSGKRSCPRFSAGYRCEDEYAARGWLEFHLSGK